LSESSGTFGRPVRSLIEQQQGEESMDKHHDRVKPEDWGREVPFEEAIIPIVFHFRPHTMVAISPEHRAEFEKYFEENVGFPPPKMKGVQQSLRAAYPNGGISGSNGGWDDSIP
jgi:hypothetical protein